jgi:predicted permease
MNLLRSFLAEIFAQQRQQRDSDLDRELRSHLELEAEEQREHGLSPTEAENAARRAFGNTLHAAEATRETWHWTSLERISQDVRFGLRMLVRNPGFSSLAILCLTLGIGANAAVFSWVEGLLLRPFPAVRHQERLMAVVGTARGVAGYQDVSWPDFRDLEKSCSLIDSFIAEKIVGARLNIGDRAQSVPGSLVSANYFDALGVHPVLGRGFQPGEDVGRNAHPVIVISYQLWTNRFHRDPNIVGKTQMLSGVPHTIIGVAPEGFYGTFVGYSFQFWVPLSMQERFEPGGYKLEDRNARWIEGFVKLKPGVTAAQAQQQISAVARRLEADYPATNRGQGIELIPLWRTPFNAAGGLVPAFETAMIVAFFVLLIACANVGNLLLVRSFARRHEMTLRVAVGARRGRLVTQLLTEGLILSVIAAFAGLVVAYWCRNALISVVPSRGVPVYLPGAIDWRVLGLSTGVCLLATLLAALAPALQTSHVDLAGALRCESAGVLGGHGRARVRSSLVLVQVALSFLLLVGAGLVIHSLQVVRTASPGFSTRGVLVTPINVGSNYDRQQTINFREQLMQRVLAISGVQSAAYGRVAPFSYRDYSHAQINVEGYQAAAGEQPSAEYNEVSPGYFATLGIPLLSGREFTPADENETGAPVAIVNENLAAQYWRGNNPVGKRIQVNGKWMRVIGVAKPIKYSNFMEPQESFLYVPLKQNSASSVMLHLRTVQDPAAMAKALAREIHTLDPELPVYEVITMREQVNQQTRPQRIAVILLGVFGALALLLACIGIYAVMSYAVSQSSRELGVRMALGASAGQLLRLVFRQGLTLTVGGILVGAAAALALTRLLGNMLYEVSPRDPLAFAIALVLMMSAALVACFFPAWRAAHTNPIQALRL